MVVARTPPPSGPPMWLMLLFWLLRMGFLAVLFAWIGRSVILLGDGERDFYTAFQRGLFLVPDTLSLAWQAVLEFTAPLRERLFPVQPLYIGPDAAALPISPQALPPSPTLSPVSSANNAITPLASFPSFAFSPAVIQSFIGIAGAQILVTLWALIARADAARMWTSPGTLAVLEPRARVVFYGLPLIVSGFEIVRAWQVQMGDALWIAAFVLLLRLFPWLLGLPFWIAEEVIGINFAALRSLSFLPRKSPRPAKPPVSAPEPPRPDYPSALALFGLSRDCTADEAMQAYRAHLRVHHPAGGGASDQVKALNAAFETIKHQRGWA